VYVHPNETGLFAAASGYTLEEWDYRTPREPIDALVKTCTARGA
jgi:hypothetical protein